MRDRRIAAIEGALAKLQGTTVAPWEAEGVTAEVYLNNVVRDCKEVERIFRGEAIDNHRPSLTVMNAAASVGKLLAWLKVMESLRDLRMLANIEKARDR